jgi:F0F1-type ATP synthase epsilon subunit
MTLYLEVLTSNGVMLRSETQEVILSTNSGQIGILTNHSLY